MFLGRIEDLTIDETTFVEHRHLVINLGNSTIALFQHLVLQAAGQRNDTFLLGILL